MSEHVREPRTLGSPGRRLCPEANVTECIVRVGCACHSLRHALINILGVGCNKGGTWLVSRSHLDRLVAISRVSLEENLVIARGDASEQAWFTVDRPLWFYNYPINRSVIHYDPKASILFDRETCVSSLWRYSWLNPPNLLYLWEDTTRKVPLLRRVSWLL